MSETYYVERYDQLRGWYRTGEETSVRSIAVLLSERLACRSYVPSRAVTDHGRIVHEATPPEPPAT
jgi:hypothetical protein